MSMGLAQCKLNENSLSWEIKGLQRIIHGENIKAGEKILNRDSYN